MIRIWERFPFQVGSAFEFDTMPSTPQWWLPTGPKWFMASQSSPMLSHWCRSALSARCSAFSIASRLYHRGNARFTVKRRDGNVQDHQSTKVSRGRFPGVFGDNFVDKFSDEFDDNFGDEFGDKSSDLPHVPIIGLMWGSQLERGGIAKEPQFLTLSSRMRSNKYYCWLIAK